MMSFIFEGLLQKKDLKRVIVRGAELEKLSLRYLKTIVLRTSPKNLQELRLVGCNLPNQSTLEQLMQIIVEEECPLNSLALIKCGISATVVKSVATFIQSSRTLDELDLSWNDLNPKDFAPLLENLNENKNLRILNLSWNTLIDASD